MPSPHLSRRQALVFGAFATATLTLPRAAFGADTDKRLVFIILRGGLDGLHAAPPFGDPNYESARRGLAIPSDQVLKIDATFGLHPALKEIYAMQQTGDMRLIHACATAYRERSHFDAQNVLETGAAKPFARDSGWLNAALGAMPAARKTGRGELAIAVADQTPLLLRGPAAVATWSPSRLPEAQGDTIARLMDLYRRTDAPLAAVLQAATATNGIAVASGAMAPGDQAAGGQLAALAKAAAEFLKQPNGPSAAVLEMTGWDTHANQGLAEGQLARVLALLDAGCGALKTELGPAWRDTVVIAATEFGRTVAMNGNGGSDHGSGAAAFLMGGAIARGGAIADWPGLSPAALYENRDLKPTTDMRAILKGVLRDHLGVPEGALGAAFPDSAIVRPRDGLIRA